MVRDYSGRRPVTKNRPRKQSAGIFAVILISAVSMSFALGVLTGWLIFKKSARKAAQNQQGVLTASPPTGSAPAPQAKIQNPEGDPSRGVEQPLTFYETLPKGGKAVIGSGLNPKKTEEKPVPNNPPPAVPNPAVPKPQNPVPPQKAAPKKEPAKAAPDQAMKESPADPVKPAKQSPEGGKYCVQVASIQDRKEAEALKTKLSEKGLAVFIIESTIKDKGTWYRVRVGRHLTHQAAAEFAEKSGKGAMVVPE